MMEDPDHTEESHTEEAQPAPEHRKSAKHHAKRHAKSQPQRAAREAAPAQSNAQPFLIGVIIVLGLLVIASAYILGYQYGKQSAAPAAGIPVPDAGAAQQQVKQPVPQATPPPPNVPKAAKPTVELFVMSYCPYGIQMEKAFVPVLETLGSKADMKVRWVDYIMHDLREIEENTRQYCIQKEEPAKYAAYLKCFVVAGNTEQCQQQAGIDKAKLQTCYNAADKEFGIMAAYNDKSTWASGRFPLYKIDTALNDKYGVQGSPTLIINGQQVSISRSAEAIKQAVCNSFVTPPAECQQKLNANQEQPSFGAIGAGAPAGGAAPAAGCGG